MARRMFGSTWWGRAWVDAIENRARLDPNRLPRGRTYARQHRVYGLEVGPGLVRAHVHGSRVQPYRVDVRFRVFEPGEWDRVAELIVASAARSAALLDGELDPGLVDDARAAGVDLLPHAGELQPRCSCPDWADPCKHSAAVCYLVADQVDDDPFALLLLRGRGRDEVLAAVRRLRSTLGADDGGADASGVGAGDMDEGVVASAAWRRSVGPLPAVPRLRSRPGHVAAWPVDPPAGIGFSAEGLTALAGDAAARAWSSLADDEPLHLDLDRDADLARRAAAAFGVGVARVPASTAVMADRAGTTERALVRRALAWRVAGADGLAVLDERAWRPDVRILAAARDVVVQAGVAPSTLRVSGNRITFGPTQLRIGHDGQWWRFAKHGSAWELDAGPARDADDLVD